MAQRLYKVATQLIDGLCARALLADKGYDSDEIVSFAELNEIAAVIPPRSNRRFQRSIDGRVYAAMHLVENAFLKIKKWRALTTRYAKTTASFEAAVQIRLLDMWMEHFVKSRVNSV